MVIRSYWHERSFILWSIVHCRTDLRKHFSFLNELSTIGTASGCYRCCQHELIQELTGKAMTYEDGPLNGQMIRLFLYGLNGIRTSGSGAAVPGKLYLTQRTNWLMWLYVIGQSFVCSPAWSGLTSAQDRARIDAFLRRSKRYRYCADSVPLITDIFAEADQSLFRRILNNESHVLHQLLPKKTNCT